MEENKQIKMSLGTSICIFIIILLVISLVGMYLYFNKDSKNNANSIVKVNSEVEMQEKEEKELYKVSDFELINKSLIDAEYNNIKSFIASDNEIEEVIVNGITIYTEEYLKAIGNSLSVDSKENEIAGSCVFTIRFKDIEGLALEGSKGNPHGKVGNCLVDQKEFVFDKTTNKIELCTGLVWKEENKNDTDVEGNIRDYEYKETITLNNKSHEIGFVYEEINSKNQEEHFQSEELEIFFDGKKIKTYTVYRQEWEKQENPEIQIIEGEDNKQYAIIVVGNINPVTTEYQFDFINDNGEIIGLADYYGGTGMNYKGKELSYKINETNMEIYKPIMIGESGNDFVIKYVLRVGNNFVNYSAEEIYKADEVEFSGSRR